METEKSTRDGKRSKKQIRSWVFLVIVLLVAFILLLLSRETITETGSTPSPNTTTALVCTASNVSYAKISSSVMENSTLEIKALFTNDSDLSNVSLTFTTRYASNEAAVAAEAVMHHEFGTLLANEGFDFTAFSNKFSVIDNKVIITLYSGQAGLTAKTAPYFMIPSSAITASKSTFKKLLAAEGINCKEN